MRGGRTLKAPCEIPFPQRVILESTSGSERDVRFRGHPAPSGRGGFFGNADPMQLEAIARGSRIERFLPDERVVSQGQPGQELYVIVEGRADVIVEQNGLSSVVNQLAQGQFFGEMSLLTGDARSTTVVATTVLKVLVVGKDGLVQLVQEDRGVIERIGAVVARRQAPTLAANRNWIGRRRSGGTTRRTAADRANSNLLVGTGKG
jgi:CRP-like cAMP-binding protein